MLHRLPRIICSVLLAMTVFSVESSIMFLVEAADDGWKIENPTPIASLLISVAPFGIFPIVTAAVVGFATLASIWNQRIRFQDILIITLLFTISFTGFAVTSQIVRSELYLDGWLSGTPLAWLVHTAVTVLLGLYAVRTFKNRKAEQAVHGNTH